MLYEITLIGQNCSTANFKMLLPWEACLPLVSAESATNSPRASCSPLSWNKTEKFRNKKQHNFFQYFSRTATFTQENELCGECNCTVTMLFGLLSTVKPVNFCNQSLSSNSANFILLSSSSRQKKHLLQNSSKKGSVNMADFDVVPDG